MARHKLGFRNRSVTEQLSICERVVASLTGAAAEQLSNINLPAVSSAVAAARASDARVRSLQAELKAERARCQALMREARTQVTRAGGMAASNAAFDPQKMLAAGLELESPKLPVGRPAAPGSVRAEPLAEPGAVQLRWERPLRRCVFEVECRAESAAENAWASCGVNMQQRQIVRDLTPGVKYWFRVRAINAHGPGPWSQMAGARVG